ncbi:hypothetical protein Poli38472_012860 [Pythium oligandrum]|uniref:Uncharacterized protein n=1 Tax=Pythium oligandrum TaxID=41045 RepID=A0A8K1CKX1_PYTOL|nr:hypothetical protein Poli38472_012860 [Pythium oligandrum]|eukprot:TMW64238.1 hypothetical protein Poli38472_012860 [Pythium oligandrum]
MTNSVTLTLENLKDAIVSAFMNAPQIDARHTARVPLDLVVPSKEAQAKVMENHSGGYWASVPQLPVPTTTA